MPHTTLANTCTFSHSLSGPPLHGQPAPPPPPLTSLPYVALSTQNSPDNTPCAPPFSNGKYPYTILQPPLLAPPKIIHTSAHIIVNLQTPFCYSKHSHYPDSITGMLLPIYLLFQALTHSPCLSKIASLLLSILR